MISKTRFYPLLSMMICLTASCAQLQGSDSCPIGYQKANAGNCVVDASCTETDKCKHSGKCTAAQKMCVATNLGDCEHSSNCSKLGECAFEISDHRQAPVGLCVADIDGCARSEICAQFGKCTPGNDGFCIVGGDQDCAQSKVCKQNGRCSAKLVPRADGKRSKVASCQM